MTPLSRWGLRACLANSVPVQWNKRLVRYEESNGQVTAYFEDGTSATADVLIGADGARSAVRHQRLPEVTYDHLGYWSISGTVPVDGEVTVNVPQLFALSRKYFLRILGREGHTMLVFGYRGQRNNANNLLWSLSWPQESEPSQDLMQVQYTS